MTLFEFLDYHAFGLICTVIISVGIAYYIAETWE